MNARHTIGILAVLFSSTLAAERTASAEEIHVPSNGQPSQYGQSSLGVGVMIGSPTGLTLKKYLTENHAFDAALGVGYGGMHVHADYLFEQQDFMGVSEARLGWFIGVGAQFQAERNRGHYYNRRYDEDERREQHLHAGLRVPIGLELRFQDIAPLEFFFEVAPGFEIVEYPGPTLDAAIGTRFYF